MLKKTVMLPLMASILMACSSAQRSSEVSASYVSSANYMRMSCSNLRSEAERVRASVADLERATDDAYQDDKTMEVVTWLLFWPAAFAMDGNSAEASRLSEARGQAEAIRSAMTEKNCRM